MYKYKKTIIINNRRRRIFSKEKSNAEYILYKKEYITLNAYNKKTGGGLLINIVTRKIKELIPEKEQQNEFDIPYNDDKHNINDNDGYNYIDNYNTDISYKISTYLKKIGKIANSINKKWIITDFSGNTGKPIKVKGYTDEEWNNEVNQRNEEPRLKDYGEKMHKQMFKAYIIDYNKIIYDTDNTKKIINDDNVYDYFEKFKNEYIKYIADDLNYKKFLYYYNLANENGMKVYNNLKKNGYYIYTILKNIRNANDYKVDTIYTLYDKDLFKCTKINEKNNATGPQGDYEVVYDIGFEYIENTPNVIGGQRKYKNIKLKNYIK